MESPLSSSRTALAESSPFGIFMIILIPVAQKRIRPTLVSMYSYVQPIIAIVISIAIGMDTITWQKVLAAIMVFGGVIIVSRSRSSH